MARVIQEPSVDHRDFEHHPAWGMIGAYRVSHSPPGSTLFDSDIQHQHTVSVHLSTTERKRDLNRDWLHADQEFLEIEMSEAQWASFVSSMNSSGVPCTIRRRENDHAVPGMPYAPRLQESMAEVRGAADRAVTKVQEAFSAYETKKNVANLHNLKYAIANMPANITFAAESLSEHAENVVQRARSDIEAMVASKAQQLGLEPGDLGVGLPQLNAGNDDD